MRLLAFTLVLGCSGGDKSTTDSLDTTPPLDDATDFSDGDADADTDADADADADADTDADPHTAVAGHTGNLAHTGTPWLHTGGGPGHTGGATGDTGACYVDPVNDCAPGPGGGYTPCPRGLTCSGLPAFWCYSGPCNPPICLPPDAAIDTPDGPVAVSALRPGDRVWTLGADGAAVIAPILHVGSTEAPRDHRVVVATLADGRVVRGSPGHPTADGRTLGELRAGDVLDEARVREVRRVRYDRPRTYDLLPAGPTGAYWSDGVLLGSTLR